MSDEIATCVFIACIIFALAALIAMFVSDMYMDFKAIQFCRDNGHDRGESRDGMARCIDYTVYTEKEFYEWRQR